MDHIRPAKRQKTNGYVRPNDELVFLYIAIALSDALLIELLPVIY